MRYKGVWNRWSWRRYQVCYRHWWLGCGVAMPTTGTAGLTLEETMKLCFSGQSSNSDKGRHRVNKKGHQACLFTVWFWSHKQRSVLSAWLRCLFSLVRKSHHCVYHLGVSVFYLMLSISKARLPLLHTRHWFLLAAIRPAVIHFFQSQVGISNRDSQVVLKIESTCNWNTLLANQNNEWFDRAGKGRLTPCQFASFCL